MQSEIKQCPDCLKTKSVQDFAKNRTKKDGLQHRCRVCHGVAMKASKTRIGCDDWNARNRVRARKGYYHWKKTDPVRWWASNAIRQARTRAKEHNVPINITVDDLIRLSSTTCPALGTLLDYQGSVKSDVSPTVDRIIPELGYTRGNIAVISDKANRIKSNGDARMLMRLVAWLSKETNG